MKVREFSQQVSSLLPGSALYLCSTSLHLLFHLSPVLELSDYIFTACWMSLLMFVAWGEGREEWVRGEGLSPTLRFSAALGCSPKQSCVWHTARDVGLKAGREA